MFSNIGSEIYEYEVDVLGSFLRVFEVCCIALNLGNAINCMNLYFRFYGYRKISLSEE